MHGPRNVKNVSSCFRLAKLLQKPFREEAMRQSVVCYCSAESRHGMTSVKDAEYSGCLPSGRRYRNVEHIYRIWHESRCITVHKLAKELGSLLVYAIKFWHQLEFVIDCVKISALYADWWAETIVIISVHTRKVRRNVRHSHFLSEVVTDDNMVSQCLCSHICWHFLKYVIFSNLLLIWVSYSGNNHHVVAVVLQEASLKMGPYLSLKCVMFQYVRWRKSEKCLSSNVIQPSWEPCRMDWLFCRRCTVQTWPHSFFGNVIWHWSDGDVVTSAQFKNSLLLYALKQCRRW